MAEWLGHVNPWVGTLIAIATFLLGYARIRIRIDKEMQSEALQVAADRNAFRQSLLEHVAHVEDKNRNLEKRIAEMDRTHRSDMATMQQRVDEAHARHMECEERFLALLKGEE